MSAPEYPMVTHARLSTSFRGIDRRFTTPGSPSVWQFRGIKFANIPARFLQATLNERFEKFVDATTFGHTKMSSSRATSPSGRHAHWHASQVPDIFDEFNCLNLNVRMPPLNQGLESHLPVMIYIHGGGGFSGSNSDWFCDGGPLVSRSIAVGKPIIIVTINYRLSALGYLGSSELKECGDVNGGNYEWVSKNIGGFGGSSTEITIYGESFGSLGVETLLHSNLAPRFSRCIMQSQVLGAPLFSNPESVATKSSVYEKVKEYLSIKTVKELRAVPWQDLFKAFAASDPRSGLAQVPMIDHVLLSENWRDNHSFAGERSGDVIIGNTLTEGTVITLVLSSAPKEASLPATKDLIASINTIIDPKKVESLFDAYQIHEEKSYLSVKRNLLKLIEDLTFYRPPYTTIQKLITPRPSNGSIVYHYSFAKRNPFAGPFQNTSAHALDLAYLHGDPAIFSGTVNESQEIEFQDKVKELWINFSNGERVWDDNLVMEMGVSREDGGFGLVEGKEQDYKAMLGRSDFAWPAIDSLSFEDMEVILPILLAHLAGLNEVD